MKKVNLKLGATSFSLLLACNGLNAAIPGAYFGAGVGPSILSKQVGATKADAANLGWRGFAGYNFDRSLGLELTYSSLGTTHYDLNFTKGVLDLKINAATLVMKGYIPLTQDHSLNVYGLVGVALEKNTAEARFNNKVVSASATGIIATAGWGINYALTRHFISNLEATLYVPKDGDKTHLALPQSALIIFGLAYKI